MPTYFKSICVATPVRLTQRVNITCCVPLEGRNTRIKQGGVDSVLQKHTNNIPENSL